MNCSEINRPSQPPIDDGWGFPDDYDYDYDDFFPDVTTTSNTPVETTESTAVNIEIHKLFELDLIFSHQETTSVTDSGYTTHDVTRYAQAL